MSRPGRTARHRDRTCRSRQGRPSRTARQLIGDDHAMHGPYDPRRVRTPATPAAGRRVRGAIASTKATDHPGGTRSRTSSSSGKSRMPHRGIRPCGRTFSGTADRPVSIRSSSAASNLGAASPPPDCCPDRGPWRSGIARRLRPVSAAMGTRSTTRRPAPTQSSCPRAGSWMDPAPSRNRGIPPRRADVPTQGDGRVEVIRAHQVDFARRAVAARSADRSSIVRSVQRPPAVST